MVKDKVDDIVGIFKGREIWKEVALIWEVKKYQMSCHLKSY